MPLGASRLSFLAKTAEAAVVEQRTAINITAGGNAQIDTAQSKFGGSSAYFDGSGDYLNTDTFAGLFDTNDDYTWEAYIRWNTTPSTNSYMMFCGNGSGRYLAYRNSGGTLMFEIANKGSSGTVYQQHYHTVSTSTWYHVAVAKNGSTVRLFLDGTELSVSNTVGSMSSDKHLLTADMYLGAYNTTQYPFDGHIDEVRLSKTARYTTGFTAPTAPFVNDANTLLLVHCDGADTDTVFIDDNGTVGGRSALAVQNPAGQATTTTADSKFGSGSMRFAGSSNTDQRLLADAGAGIGTGDYTVECWAKFDDFSALHAVAYAGGAPAFYVGSDGKISFYYSSGTTGTTVMSTNTWYHLAWCRSGTTLRMFLNGNLEATRTGVNDSLSSQFILGCKGINDQDMRGYMDEFRVSNTARYTAAFTAPTAAFVNDADTKLLLHFNEGEGNTTVFDDNGQTLPTYVAPEPTYASDSYSQYLVLAMPFDDYNGIADVSADIRGSGTNCSISAGGNSSVSTTAVRYDGQGYAGALENVNTSGTTSITASLTTSIPSSASGTYVVEGWFKANNATTNGNWCLSSADSGGRWLLGINNGVASSAGAENKIGIGSTDWHHIAIVSTSGSKVLYVDGAYKNTFNSGNTGFSTLHIGQFNAGDNNDFQGHIQDLRVYVGTNKGYTGTSTTSANFDLPGPIIQYFSQPGAVQPFGLGDNAVDLDTSTYIKGNAQPNTALYNTSSINTHPAFTLSMWVKVSSSSPGWTSGQGFVWEDIMNGGGFPARWQVEYNATNKIQFEAYNSSGSRIIRTGYNQGTGASGGAITADTWYWLGASYNSAVGSSARVYIAPLNGSPTAQTYYSNTTSAQTLITNWNYSTTNNYKDRLGIGARYAGNVQSDVCVADIWYGNEYIDLSVQSNREKFITSSGTPANLGAYGESVTGNLPSLFLSGDATNFHKNLGTLAVPLTVGGGTVTDCANAPGD